MVCGSRLVGTGVMIEALSELAMSEELTGAAMMRDARYRRLLYLSPAYRQLKVGGTSTSVWEDFSSRLDECGIEVVDKCDDDEGSETGSDVPAVLLIAPGVWETPAIMEHFQEVTERANATNKRQPGKLLRSKTVKGSKDGLVSKVGGALGGAVSGALGGLMLKSDGRRHRTGAMVSDGTGGDGTGRRSPLSLRTGAGLQSIAGGVVSGAGGAVSGALGSLRSSAEMGSSSASGLGVGTPKFIRLYSTERSFAWYMNGCPKALRDAGFFNLIFAKWPASWVLQEAAAVKLTALAKTVERPLNTKVAMKKARTINFGGWRPLTALDGEAKTKKQQLARSATQDGVRSRATWAAARPPKWQMNAAAGALQTAWRARGERVKDAPAAAPPDADAKAGATANHRAVRRFAQTSKATPAVRFAGGKAPASASPPASSPPASSQLPAAAPSAVETA